MKSTGKLIRKEELRSNFKLFFSQGQREFFLILHANQKVIYHNLKIGSSYSFFYKKGIKYNFLREKTISITTKNFNKKMRKQKTIYIHDLAQKLGIKKMTFKNIEKKLAKTIKETDNANYSKQAKQLIQLLFLKHQELNKKLAPYTGNKEQLEKALLTELKTMFLINFTYPDQN